MKRAAVARRVLLAGVCCVAWAAAAGQGQAGDAVAAASAASAADTVARTIAIEPVRVTARRPMNQIGVQRTVLDTVVLRNTVTASMADALTAGSTIFIKSYGRATLATASFRGTAPSHMQVTWNGMRINSPMLGQVDFSLIPSYFIDNASLYHGASSVGIISGGLGGAVALGTQMPAGQGWGLRYVQGVGSFTTLDEYLRLTYSGARWSSSTRVLCSTSKNDFGYRNYNTKRLITDPDGNIVGSEYPWQRNSDGGFRDIHIMQELYHTTRGGDRWSLAAWWMDSHRGLPLMTSDTKAKNSVQDEQTLRVVAGWDRLRGYGGRSGAGAAGGEVGARGGADEAGGRVGSRGEAGSRGAAGNGLGLNMRIGYTYTDLRYLQRAEADSDDGAGDSGGVDAEGLSGVMVDARSKVHTLLASAAAEYTLGERWSFSAGVTAYQHMLRSGDFSVINNRGEHADTLYKQQRFELSASGAVKWRPVPRLGIAANLRWELYGDSTTPLIPALLADYLLSERGKVILKASAARNYRPPTLSDLYFRPGGNKDLRPEKGLTWDAGAECSLQGARRSLTASATLFDSYIDDWILWIRDGAKPDIYTPVNIRRVHSYGVELKLDAETRAGRDWLLAIDGHGAWTRSINQGEPFSPADESVGKQLVYIPVWSAALTARASWRTWTLSFKWTYYSERFTMTDNNKGVLGVVKPYFMSDLALEKIFEPRWASISLKACIYNLLNEEYETVSSHPMPRLNASFFIGITPKLRSK